MASSESRKRPIADNAAEFQSWVAQTFTAGMAGAAFGAARGYASHSPVALMASAFGTNSILMGGVFFGK